MTIKRFFLLVTLSVFLSCSSPKYEYIIKDDLFRTTIKKGNFLELKNGYTYFNINNRSSENTLVFIHGFSVPSYIWDKTYNSAIVITHTQNKYKYQTNIPNPTCWKLTQTQHQQHLYSR